MNNVNFLNEFKESVLHYFILNKKYDESNNNNKLVKYVVKHTNNININSIFLYTPLFLCITLNRYHILKYILEYHGNILYKKSDIPFLNKQLNAFEWYEYVNKNKDKDKNDIYFLMKNFHIYKENSIICNYIINVVKFDKNIYNIIKNYIV